MDPATITGQIRVAVIGDGAFAEIALPTTLPIRELIPRIRDILRSGRDDTDLPDEAEGGGTDPRPYSLAVVGGTPFSLDATFETLAVDDGEALLLCQLPPGPAAPPVVEDIADAAAIHSASQFKPFTHALMPAVTQVVGLVLGMLICGLSLMGWRLGHHLAAAATLGGLALVFVVTTVVLLRRGHQVAAGRLGLATTVPLALAAAAALPGDGWATRVFLGAAAVVAWSLLLLSATSSWIAVYTAAITLGSAIAVASAMRILWHLPYLTLGCGFLVLSLMAALNAPTMSAVWAKFPLPNVPAPGEPTPSPSSLAQIEDLPRKTAISNSYQNGLIASSVILVVLGATLALWLPAGPPLLAWWLIAAVVTVTVLRMRIWDSAIAALWFLATPFATAAALAVSFAAAGHLQASLYAAGGAGVITGLLLLATLLKPRALSVPRRSYLSLFENALLITIMPVSLWLVGLVSLILNRRV